jgi:hypothetical protein
MSHRVWPHFSPNVIDTRSPHDSFFIGVRRSSLDRPVFLGPTTPIVFSVANYRGETVSRVRDRHSSVRSIHLAIMKCRFDSYPSPTIQWVKMVRTADEPEGGHVLVQDNDPQVIDILTRQIGPTTYETQMTVRTVVDRLHSDIVSRSMFSTIRWNTISA